MPQKTLPQSVNIVALPLGNPHDLSLRALNALKGADLIFCEDTRKFLTLANQVGLKISAKLEPLPGSSEFDLSFDKYCNNNHANWALVSDAGTPLLNDPGRALVLCCREHQVDLKALPGPCAPILALQWSGGFGLPFFFAGFAPKGAKGALELFFETARNFNGTFAYFDTKHQAALTLHYLATQADFSDRKIFVAREMSKVHEELIQGNASECLRWLETKLEANKGIGEMTFLLEAKTGDTPKATVSVNDLIELRKSSPRKAAQIAARLTGLSVNECYKKLSSNKGKAS